MHDSVRRFFSHFRFSTEYLCGFSLIAAILTVMISYTYLTRVDLNRPPSLQQAAIDDKYPDGWQRVTPTVQPNRPVQLHLRIKRERA